jgi:hypothetical protein
MSYPAAAVTRAGAIPGTASMSDIQTESEKNFEALQKELPKLKALRGKYFLMRRGRIVNFYDTFQDAYSTGAAVYDDNMFSVILLRGANKAAEKKPTKKAAKKKVSKKRAAKKVAMRAAGTPSRGSIPGIAPDLPDIYPDWREGAAATKVRPYYNGADSYPFSCLRATQIRMDPPIRRGGIAFVQANEFYVSQECRNRGPH